MTDAPHNRWQDSANELVARKFLDEASPIILADRVLSAEKQAELQAIATRLGMSREQLDFELHLLEQRGVIALAPRPPSPTPGATDEIQFLEDPAPTPPPDSPTNATASSADVRPPPIRPRPQVRPVAGPSPPRVAPPPVVRIVKAAPEDRVTAFLEKAVIVLAKHKGLDAQCQLLLMAEATHFGLSPEEAWDAIGTLLQRQQRPAPAPRAEPQPVPQAPLDATRVEPAPIDASPAEAIARPTPVAPPVVSPESIPAPPCPADTYRQYLREMMGKLTAGIISEKIEKQFVRVGRKSHSLASVYIQHLITEVADELGIRVLSQEAAHTESTDQELTPQDEKLERFLEQVAPIIAEYRGINARSKLLMSAVAAEEGLSESELQAAITSLQGQTASTTSIADEVEQQLQQRQASFDKHLREALAELPNGVLTPKLRSHLLEAGELREGLPRESVETTIANVANEMQVLSVSEDNASEHLRGLITHSLKDGSEIPPASLQKLYAEGLQWGLRREQVDALIDAEIERNWQQQRTHGKRTALLLGLSLTTAMALLVGVLWVVITRPSERPPDTNPAVADADTEPIEPAPQDDTSWWNSDLKIAVAEARVNAEAWRDDLDLLRAVDPQKRQQAYRGLLKTVIGSETFNQDDWLRLAELWTACFALEPATQNADFLQTTLLELVPTSDAAVADHALAYDQAFAAIEVLTQMAKHAATPTGRGEALTRALASRMAINIDTTLSHPDMQRVCSMALVRQAYRGLTALTDTQVDIAVALHKSVAQHATTYLDANALLDLEADFLIAILPNLKDGWRQFESLIDRCIADGDPVVVLRLTNFYEQLASKELQAYMGIRLLERAAPNQRNRNVPDVVREVNRAFGGTSDDRPDARWSELARHAQRYIAAPLADQRNMHRVLNQTLTRAHLNTLAVAAARGQSAAALFDAKLGETPPKLVSPPNTPPLRRWPTKPPGGDTNAVRQLRATLRLVTESRFGKQRTDALENLAELADEIRFITRPQATVLARYLVRPRERNSDEHQAILEHIQELGRWQRVQLALSEQLYSLKSPDNQIHEMLEALAGKLPLENDVKKWQEAWRIALLENILDALTADGNRSNQGKSYDTCRDQLTEIYRQQASLLKIPDDVLASATEPATLLRRMIPAWGAELMSQASTQDAAFLQRLDHELTVDSYLSSNQIEAFVALQRTWLRLVQIYVRQEAPANTDAADQLSADLASKDREATDLFVQLRDGEEAILRTWLLMATGDTP